MTWTADHKHFYRFKFWTHFRDKPVMKFECEVKGCKDWRLVQKGYFG